MTSIRKLTVGQLVLLIKEVVETNFVAVTVEGEISNFVAPASGHWYFTLKDADAQLRAVMFRGRNRLTTGRPADGLRVVCSGTVSLYAARGEVQLVVDELVPAGRGDLQAAFEALKARLDQEGLFAASRKRTLPEFPQRVGVVTSPTGAAVRDILNILRRRAPGLPVLLCPTRVQGTGAAEEIAAAIELLNRDGRCDVLIVGRGGGSLEDLWAFNEEIVARAIAASEIPVIAAVGHEVDVTIADFVADLRAPTPSAAAELVAKSRLELESHLDHLVLRLQSRLRQILTLAEERIGRFEDRLIASGRDLVARQQAIAYLHHRLLTASRSRLRHAADRLGAAAGRLDALSPLRQLARGYAIASRERDGVGLKDATGLSAGERLWLRFARGRARVQVDEVEE